MNELVANIPSGKVRLALWRLLQRQAMDYTMGDSDSLPVEVAEELFHSILYTLKLYLNTRGEDLYVLEVRDEQQLFRDALAYHDIRLTEARTLYQGVQSLTPTLEHMALRDTLHNIGIGLERYNYRHFAHEPPGEIDYQLCLPVPDTLQGIEWTEEYLRRLWVESLFIRCFNPRECMRFLEARFPDYRLLLINLFEPIMSCALGCLLTETPLATPRMAFCPVSSLPPRLTKDALRTAALWLCDDLRLPQECRDYIADCAAALLPRYLVAAENGTLTNLFGAPLGFRKETLDL